MQQTQRTLWSFILCPDCGAAYWPENVLGIVGDSLMMSLQYFCLNKAWQSSSFSRAIMLFLDDVDFIVFSLALISQQQHEEAC